MNLFPELMVIFKDQTDQIKRAFCKMMLFARKSYHDYINLDWKYSFYRENFLLPCFIIISFSTNFYSSIID